MSFLMMAECACYSVLLRRETPYYRPALSVASGAGCADGDSAIRIRSDYLLSPSSEGRGPMLSASQELCAAEKEGTGQRTQALFSS